MKGIPKELKDYKVIKTIQGLSGKSISELNGHYVQNIWTDTGLEIKSGAYYAEGQIFYVTEQPWTEDITITKAA